MANNTTKRAMDISLELAFHHKKYYVSDLGNWEKSLKDCSA